MSVAKGTGECSWWEGAMLVNDFVAQGLGDTEKKISRLLHSPTCFFLELPNLGPFLKVFNHSVRPSFIHSTTSIHSVPVMFHMSESGLMV